MKTIKKNVTKSILIPVFDVCNIPPLDKVVKLANQSQLRIHIAGFISSGKEPGKLMEQTIRLTRILKVILHRLNGKVRSVSSKIYTTSKPTKVNKLLKDEQVKVVVSQKLNRKILDIKRMNGKLLFLQLCKSRNIGGNDALVICKDGQSARVNAVKQVLDILENKIQVVENRSIDGDETKASISSLEEKVTLGDIRNWIEQHAGGCVAIEKESLLENESLQILEQEKTSVLLY